MVILLKLFSSFLKPLPARSRLGQSTGQSTQQSTALHWQCTSQSTTEQSTGQSTFLEPEADVDVDADTTKTVADGTAGASNKAKKQQSPQLEKCYRIVSDLFV